MNLIDSHCHLDFLDNLPELLSKAREQQVNTFICPAVNFQSSQNLLQIADENPQVYVSLGLQPIDTNDESFRQIYPEQEIKKTEKLLTLKNPKIIAIGECGLDFKFTNVENSLVENFKNIQVQLFKQHLKWASEFNLPLIIHNRRAGNELINIIENCKLNIEHLSGVFHCFSGGKKLVKKILNFENFYFGIGGLVTLDTGLMEVIKHIPLEKIILETDSPYLTPKPIRDQQAWPNTPANLKIIAQKLAELKNESFAKIAHITTKNCQKLFSLG